MIIQSSAACILTVQSKVGLQRLAQLRYSNVRRWGRDIFQLDLVLQKQKYITLYCQYGKIVGI